MNENGYIRGRYNAMAPYHLWHKVASVGRETYLTACGLGYYPEDVQDDVSTFEEVQQR